jgi:hypothetical protein
MLSSLPVILAVEFKEATTPKIYFQREAAQPLANQLSFELGKQLKTLDRLGLVWMAASYDSAQLLRPGLPIFKALDDLYRAGLRDPLDVPQVMTLQALRGNAPSPDLNVDESLLGGPMVFIPLLLMGEASAIADAGQVLEANLLETGLTDARTALMLVEALGHQAEHARLMTLNDLAAMMSMQYSHVGMQDVWSVIEAAVLQVSADHSTTSIEPSGSADLKHQNGVAVLALQSFDPEAPAEDRALQIEALLKQRQIIALLQAHALPIDLLAPAKLGRHSEISALDYWIELAQPHGESPLQASHFRALIDPGSGLIACELFNAAESTIGLAYPLSEPGAQALKVRLADLKRLPSMVLVGV